MEYINDETNLKAQITATRAIMYSLWNQRGCFDDDLLEVSTQLDCLINQYQRLLMKKPEAKCL